MKYCEDYAALLDPYIDGELSPEDTARVREHLTVCAGCRAYVQAALLLRENFPEIEDTEVPDGFAESVMGAIRSGGAPRKQRRAPWAKVLLPLAACCAIVILAKSLPAGVSTADTAAASAVTEESVPDMAQARDDTSAARSIEPETAAPETGENAAETPAAAAAGEAETKTGTAADAVQPHVYTAQTNGQAEAGTSAGEAVDDAAGAVTESAGTEEAAQPATPSENSVTAATTAQDTAWFATLTLTPAQAGTALETLPGDVPVSNDPDTGGTVYWLTAEQFETLLAQLGQPAYTAEGEGDLARVILLPE